MQAAPFLAEYGGLLAAGLSAAGTVAQMQAAEDERNQKRQILNRQLERDDQASQKSNEQVLQEGQRYAQANRQQGLQDAEDQTYKQTQADLQGAGGANIGTAGEAGNVSEDFLKTKAARAIDEGNRLTQVARETAKSRAPGQLQMGDSLSMANLAGNLQNLWGTTKNMSGATNLDAQDVSMPMYGQLGKVASAVAPLAGAQQSGVSWDADGSYARKYGRGKGM